MKGTNIVLPNHTGSYKFNVNTTLANQLGTRIGAGDGSDANQSKLSVPPTLIQHEHTASSSAPAHTGDVATLTTGRDNKTYTLLQGSNGVISHSADTQTGTGEIIKLAVTGFEQGPGYVKEHIILNAPHSITTSIGGVTGAPAGVTVVTDASHGQIQIPTVLVHTFICAGLA